MDRIRWDRLPHLREFPTAHDWLVQEALAGLSPVTLEAYSRAVERFLVHCRERRIPPARATTGHIVAYLDELARAGLRSATLLQRLTALRIFYAFIVDRGDRADNPAANLSLPGQAVPRDQTTIAERAPWIPSEPEWLNVLTVARAARPRTRLMLALAYEGALRREELCRLRIADVDLGRASLRVPNERGATHRETALSRVVVGWCVSYVVDRSNRPIAGPDETALFLSESPRNRREPISIWTWSKVVASLASEAGLPRFTTHTPRHLRLTDLARAGWSTSDIAQFAGYSRSGLAQPYLALATMHPEPKQNTLEIRAEQLADVLLRAG
jgi:site-specific recombinase XerD